MPAIGVVRNLGINTYHLPGEVSGLKITDCLVMCFNTPFFCTTTRGVEHGRAGDSIIHCPGFTQSHGPLPGADEGFRNDWVHVEPSLGGRLLARYELAPNTLLRTGGIGLLTPFLRTILREQMGGYPFGAQAVEREVEGAFLEIARRLALTTREKLSPGDQDVHADLMGVRLKMNEGLARDWSLPDLADMANMSVSHFSSLYRRHFGVSPIDDLIRMRIDHARMRIADTSASLAQIARMCGFSNVYYFSRIFKQRVGVPPGRYRRERSAGRRP